MKPQNCVSQLLQIVINLIADNTGEKDFQHCTVLICSNIYTKPEWTVLKSTII